MKIKASVFIPSSRDANSLEKCLESLNSQTLKDFEVIIVSKEKSVSIENLVLEYRKLPIKYIIQQKPGLVGASNEALRITKSPIFIRIDDDVVVTRKWLENVVGTFRVDKKIAAVTGPTLIDEKGLNARDSISFLSSSKKTVNPLKKLTHLITYSYLYENRVFEVGSFFKSGAFSLGANFPLSTKINIKEVENIEACNYACKSDLLKKLNGFDETFSKGLGEYHEADIACKMRKLGYKIIFNPKAVVWHKIENQISTSRPDAYFRIQNFIKFYKRYIGFRNFDYSLRFATYLVLQNIYYICKFFTTGDFHQLGSIPGTFVGLMKK